MQSIIDDMNITDLNLGTINVSSNVYEITKDYSIRECYETTAE